MKKITTTLFVLIFFFAIAMVGCKNNSTESTQEGTTTDTTAVQTAEMYECPMKCEGKTYDKMGKCDVCGMDLVKMEKK